jgi:hypothetical protein
VGLVLFNQSIRNSIWDETRAHQGVDASPEHIRIWENHSFSGYQSTSSLVSLLQWNPLSINLLAQVLANRLETLAFAHKIEFEAEANAEHSSRNAGASSYRRYLIHTGKARMIEVIPCFRQKGQLTWVARTQ